RYAELIWRDGRSLRLLLLQAPVVGLFILLGFVNQPYEEEILAPRKLTEAEQAALRKIVDLYKVYRMLDPKGEEAERIRKQIDAQGEALGLKNVLDDTGQLVGPLGGMVKPDLLEKMADQTGPVVPDRMIVNPRPTYMLLFVLVISVLWFGCNNAAKEIVKEDAIYARERAINLGIGPYLASKFVVLAAISALQVLAVMVGIFGALEGLHALWALAVPPPFYCLDYLAQFGVLVLLATSGLALGLLLSACVASPDRAATLLPYALIPQIILGGAIMPVTHGPLHIVALICSPAYW